MLIRYLSDSDDPLEISRIYEQSWKYAYKGIIPQDYLDSIPCGRWANLDAQNRKHLVAVHDSKLIGTASFCPSRWEQHKNCGEIISIYFLPEYIGKGFGRLLLQECVKELKKDGFDRIILWVLEENHAARRFYEKNGFVCTRELRQDNIGGKPLRETLYSLNTTDAK